MVGIILHERRTARQTSPHDFQHPPQRCRLPIALGAEAVAIGHEPLHRDAGQLLEPGEIFEAVGEGAEAAGVEKGPQGKFGSGGVSQRLATLAAGTQRRRHRVLPVVFGHEALDLGIGHVADAGGQFADAVAVDLNAEADLGLDLVALGDGDLPHVVAQAGDLQRSYFMQSGGGPLPGGQAILHLGVLPMADDDLARPPHPRADEAELAVAVGGLVQVHEVHVDRSPGQIAVELRVQMGHRLLEGGQPGNPHLRRRKRVHPADYARAARRGVGLAK